MATNLDRLFREGLDQLEVAPKEQSWSQVQDRLNGKKKKVWIPLSTAAAIALLITSALVVMKYQSIPEIKGHVALNIDHPRPELQQEPLIIPTKEEKASQTVVTVIKKTVHKKPEVIKDQNSNTTEEQNNIELIQMNVLQVVAIEEMQVGTLPEVDFPNDFKSKKDATPTPSVKITYIAENKPAEKKNKLNEFIQNISKDASPIEILADIRDAKDQIFSRN